MNKNPSDSSKEIEVQAPFKIVEAQGSAGGKSPIDLLSEALQNLRGECVAVKTEKYFHLIHTKQIKSDLEALYDIQRSLKTKLGQTIIEGTPFQPSAKIPTPIHSVGFIEKVSFDWEMMLESPKYSRDNVKLLYALKTKTVLCTVDFSNDGEQIIFADSVHVFVVHAASGSLQNIYEIPHMGQQSDIHTRRIRVSRNGRWIAVTIQQNSIAVFDRMSNHQPSLLKGHTSAVTAIAFSENSATLFSGGFDGKLIIWDLETGQILKTISHKGKEDEKEDMIFSLVVDDSFVIVGFMSGSIGIYEASFSQPRNEFSAHSEKLLDVSCSHNGFLLVSSSADQSSKIWTLQGVVRARKHLKHHTDYVLTARFSPDDQIVLTGSKDETVIAWDQESGQPLFRIGIGKDSLFEIAHHPTKAIFAACSGEGFITVWDYSRHQI